MSASDESIELARLAAEAASDKLATDIVVRNVLAVTPPLIRA